MSSAGKWATIYASANAQSTTGRHRGHPEPSLFGDLTTYEIGADWLARCPLVEDWGCGLGGFRVVRSDGVVGVDGTATPWADIIADLTEYRSDVPGIFMRHVLEHNDAWQPILANACASFTDRMALVMFTPVGLEPTREIACVAGIPDLAICLTDLRRVFADAGIAETSLRPMETATQYGTETIVLVEK